VGLAQGSGLTTIGKVYIASPFQLAVGPFGAASMFSSYSGGPIVWGGGKFGVQGTARVFYPAGSGQAVATFALTGGITINNIATAHSVFTASNVDTPCGGITVNAANLDLASSATCATTGFGGLAFNYGGASITNGGL
jgi:hypothetical protein